MALFAGAPNIRNTYAQTSRNLKNLQRYFLPSQQAIQDAAEVITPQEQELFSRMYQQYAPEFAETGVGVNRISQLGNVQNDLAALEGGGGDLLQQLLSQEDALSPGVASARDKTLQGFEKLLGAQDPTKLSGSELAETERGINRMNTNRGNINVADATSTAAAAGEFGNALAGKQARFGQALSLFPSLAGASKSNISPFEALGRSGQSNPGVQQYSYNPSTASQGAAFQGQSAATTGQVEQMRQQQPTTMDMLNSGWGGLVSPVCGCYIFRAYYGYPDVPLYLRWVRDWEYRRNPSIKEGYKKMARWLVPLMQRYSIVRRAVAWLMLIPLEKHAKYRTGYSKWGRLALPFKGFWLTVWSIYGKV